MTNQEIMDLADQYLYDTGGKNYGIIEFAKAIESRTRASVIGEWFKEGVRVEREACAKVCESLRDEDGYEAWGVQCAEAIRERMK